MFHTFFLLFLSCSIPIFAATRLSEMTLEEKVGQILMVHFHGEVATEEARQLVQEMHVAGFIYYNWSNRLSSPEQVLALSNSLQKLAEIPLLIAIDQEGGRVNRLNEGFTVFPANQALGRTGNPQLARACAKAMGLELRAVGINMNLAPVVDVNSNPHNPVIGPRAYGDDPQTVLTFAEKALQGFHEAKILAVIKHFPGHGDVEIDSHADLPVVHKPLEALNRVELLPFKNLAPAADAIMTAHILVPALDDKHCSTLSPTTLSYLRNELGFKGVIITDSLVMKGVLKACGTVDEAAIQALRAGCDILLLGGKQLLGGDADFELCFKDIQRIHHTLVQAVQQGQIPQSRLDEAVKRILALKERFLLEAIGDKIWRNECGGKVEQLTHWNKGENFASLGIGHFIWFPAEQQVPFEETFPLLLTFLIEKGAHPPLWLQTAKTCPWHSREEFYHQLHSPEMNQLREFLYATKDLQALYIIQRLEAKFPDMIAMCTDAEKAQVSVTFSRLSADPKGLFALIDYLNFKGAGISPTEAYQGEGWGLLHVLKRIPVNSVNPLQDFVAAATGVLEQRVQNAPPERNEERWLKGWLNRLNSYLQP